MRKPRREPDPNRILALMSDVHLRLAGPRDQDALARLAALDDRVPPPGPHLIARADGEPRAAISLVTGEIIADPFRRSLELGELLRCHAAGARVRPSDPIPSVTRS
jgi:hypothetical protein